MLPNKRVSGSWQASRLQPRRWRQLARPRSRHSIQVEINRKLYMDERTLEQQPQGMARLQADLTALVHKLLAVDPR